MSKLRAFLKRRSETLQQERSGRKSHTEEQQATRSKELTDEQFWDILRRMKEESEAGGESAFEVLVRILEAYSEEQVEQFVRQYELLME